MNIENYYKKQDGKKILRSDIIIELEKEVNYHSAKSIRVSRIANRNTSNSRYSVDNKKNITPFSTTSNNAKANSKEIRTLPKLNLEKRYYKIGSNDIPTELYSLSETKRKIYF